MEEAPGIPLLELEGKTLEELQEEAVKLELGEGESPAKAELVRQIMQAQARRSGLAFSQGNLEILSEGFGFLRTRGYLSGPEDVYVSQSQIRRFGLRTGDSVAGLVHPPKGNDRYASLVRVEAVNGDSIEVARQRSSFDELTSLYPQEQLKMETEAKNIMGRVIDLVAPIGKGQRGMIVSPPKAGKTTLLKCIANSITANHPEVVLIVLLIDERPEEVTDIRRSVEAEVVASTFDELPENHLKVQEMVLEKAKRLVEHKKDVVVLLDSLTRLGRASNLTVAHSGRTLSGGLDPSALYRPKRFFAAARNIEEGGSLTIVATALVETGSRLDDMIFEEFKATGNMELVLDRSLADRGIFPAVDIPRSGTRHQELLFTKEELQRVFALRRVLNAMDTANATETLLTGLKQHYPNSEFLQFAEKAMRE